MGSERREFGFERLKVYQKSLVFIDGVFEVYRELPNEFRYSVGSNLVRAALSVANNIAEGSDKESKKERARYYQISSDSVRESVSVLIILDRQKMLSQVLYDRLRDQAFEITSMLGGLKHAL